jgi:hypothetical protein
LIAVLLGVPAGIVSARVHEHRLKDPEHRINRKVAVNAPSSRGGGPIDVGNAGTLLRLLPGKGGNFCAMFGHLVQQKLTLGSSQFRIRTGNDQQEDENLVHEATFTVLASRLSRKTASLNACG